MKLWNKIRRRTALFAAAGIAIISVFAASSFPALAVETTGYWELVETNIRVAEDEIGTDGYASNYYTASELSHSFKVSVPKTDYHGSGFANFEVTCTAPPAVIYPGDKVVMHLNITMSKGGDHGLRSCYGAVEFGDLNDERNGMRYNVQNRFEAVEEGGSRKVSMDTFDNPPVVPSTDVCYVVNEKGEPGSEKGIDFYGAGSSTVWIYRWVDTTPAAAPVEEDTYVSGSDDDLGNGHNDESVYEEEPEEEEEPYVEQDVVNDALTEAGEDEGSDMIPAIIIGVGGAVAAGGAAAAAGGGSGKGTDEGKEKEEEKKRFKMYISKDFGDAIKRGASPVIVRARIDQISRDGGRIPRPDLTGKITATGNGLEIAGVYQNGGWAEAHIFAEEYNTDDKASVTFAYSSEYGIFRNHVVFRLVGKPYIVFPEQASYSDGMYLKMMAGDPDEYTVKFFFEDTVEEPTEIELSGGERFNVSYREAENERTYYAVVTGPPGDPHHNIFAEPERGYISIHAKFEDGDVVDGGFNVEVWPEGLSISSRHIEKGRLVVYTMIDKNAGDLDYEIKPTDFTPRLCYKDADTGDAVFLTGEDIEADFSDIYEAEKYGNTFKENFRYEMEKGHDIFAVAPKDTLPMIIEGYDVLMDIACRAGGSEYTGTLPLRFMGERPLPPSRAQRQEALDRLKKAIEEYGVDSNPTIKSMIRNVEYYSPADIEFLRGYIILMGCHFYSVHSRAHTEFGDLCDRYVVVASAMAKAGDIAFTIMMTEIFGEAGDVAAKFINPLKNMYFSWVGQYYGLGAEPDMKVDPMDLKKAIVDGLKDYLEGVITGEEKPDPEALGVAVAGYLMCCFYDHYYNGENGEKGDVYKSLLASAGDLAFAKLKEYISGIISEKCKAYNEKIQKWFGEKFQELYKNLAAEAGVAMRGKTYTKELMKLGNNVTEKSIDNAYKVAKNMGGWQEHYFKEFLGKRSEKVYKASLEGIDASVGFVLNCFFRQFDPEMDEIENLKATDLLWKLFKDVLGLTVERISEIPTKITGIVDVRFQGTNLVFVFDGYEVEINVLQNSKAILDIFFTYTFLWMDKIYQYCTKDTSSLPDARDFMEYNEDILDETLQMVENPEPVKFTIKQDQ